MKRFWQWSSTVIAPLGCFVCIFLQGALNMHTFGFPVHVQTGLDRPGTGGPARHFPTSYHQPTPPAVDERRFVEV